MKISELNNKLLKKLIFPVSSLIISLSLYFIFINSYLKNLATFDETKVNHENSINTLKSNLAVLETAEQKKDKILKLDDGLKSLIPESANPSDTVGLVGKKSEEFRFRTVDENRSVNSPENTKNNLIEIRFNGRSPGMASSISFINSLVRSKVKLIKLTSLELTNVPDELYTRVSFNAFSIFSPSIPNFSMETPLENVFEDEKFMNMLNNF